MKRLLLLIFLAALPAAAQTQINGNYQHNGNETFKGQNPYTDVTTYGARAVNLAGIPSSTATISLGSPTTVSLAGVSTFQNGDGVAIIGAGAANTLGTPPAPTVTPSQPTGAMNIGQAVASATGSTSTTYKVFARDQNGGLTAAGSVTTQASGLPLGQQSIAVSGCTRSNNTSTCATSSQTIAVTAQFCLTMSSGSDASFNGCFVAGTGTNSTTLVFLQGSDTRAGDSAASVGGGTAIWQQENQISWTAASGSPWQYFVCTNDGRILPARPGELQVEDYGAIESPSPSLPWYFPGSCPSSATNDLLVSKITAGGGTTSLTIANAATNAVSGASIRFDNAPNIFTAATAASTNGTGSILEFSAPLSATAYYVTSSFLDLSGLGAILHAKFNGSIANYDTVRITNTTILEGDSWTGNTPQFGIAFSPTWNCQGAWPCVQAKGVIGGPSFKNLTFINSSNGLAIQLGGADQSGGGGIQGPLFETVSFSLGSGGTDYTGMAIAAYGATLSWNKVTITPSTPAGNYTTMAPEVLTRPDLSFAGPAGSIFADYFSTSQRGIAIGGNGGSGAYYSFKHSYRQGGTQPFLMFSDNGRGDLARLELHVEDTSSVCTLANWSSPLPIRMEIFGLLGATTATGNTFCGFPFATVITDESSLSGGIGSGQTFNVADNGFAAISAPSPWGNAVQGAWQTFRKHIFLPAGHSVIFNLGPPAGVSSSATSGGSLTTGVTVYYGVSAMGRDGGETAVTGPVSCTPSGGNLTCTTTWTALPGAVTYNVYHCNVSSCAGTNSAQVGITTTSFADSTGANVGARLGPTFGASGLSTVDATGLYGPQVAFSVPTTVTGLGSAATNLNSMRVVTDSTAISAEGQTCVGSSTNTALAFSNGTIWKCF